MHHFHTAHQLKQWLQTQNVQFTLWGRANAKTVEDLFRELEFGESTLVDSPARRYVRVVSIVIQRQGKQLLELQQQLRDGRTRDRQLRPSEKLKQDETWDAAAIRCLHEELGVEAHRVTLKMTTHTVKTELKNSYSYPTLLSCYELHTVEADVTGLPDHDFCVPNGACATTDAIQVHHWGWR